MFSTKRFTCASTKFYIPSNQYSNACLIYIISDSLQQIIILLVDIHNRSYIRNLFFHKFSSKPSETDFIFLDHFVQYVVIRDIDGSCKISISYFFNSVILRQEFTCRKQWKLSVSVAI